MQRSVEMDKFNNVPVEEDTIIIFRKRATIGEYKVLHEMWVWDGITAESIIFATEDIVELTDKEIEKKVKMLPFVNEGPGITLKRTDSGFTFVNFNFKTE